MSSTFPFQGSSAVAQALTALREEIQKFNTSYAEYEITLEDWERFHKHAGHARPRVKAQPPAALSLYWRLQRWTPSLLVRGGILNQPAWTWRMVEYAGLLWEQGKWQDNTPSIEEDVESQESGYVPFN